MLQKVHENCLLCPGKCLIYFNFKLYEPRLFEQIDTYSSGDKKGSDFYYYPEIGRPSYLSSLQKMIVWFSSVAYLSVFNFMSSISDMN